MIYDLRLYPTAPGRTKEYIDLHEQIAFPIMTQYLGQPVGYWLSMSGEINRFVHMWRFEDLGDMERKHAALVADPAWHAYRDEALGKRGLVQRQESILLRPTSFSPLK